MAQTGPTLAITAEHASVISFQGDPGRYETLESATDLSGGGNWQFAAEIPGNATGTYAVTNVSGTGALFYRTAEASTNRAEIVTEIDPNSPLAGTIETSTNLVTDDIPLAVYDLEAANNSADLDAVTLSVSVDGTVNGQPAAASGIFGRVQLKIAGKTYCGTVVNTQNGQGEFVFNNMSVCLQQGYRFPAEVIVEADPGIGNADVSVSLDTSESSDVIAKGHNGTMAAIQDYGTLSGATITLQDSGLSAIIPRSVGSPTYTATTEQDVSGYTAATYPFTFTVTAGTTQVYISATPSSAVWVDTSLSGTPGVSGDAKNTIPVSISAGSPIAGDTNQGLGVNATGSFVVLPNTSRTFTVSVIINNYGNAANANNAIVGITGVYYSTAANASESPTPTSSELLYTSGFSGFQSPGVSLLNQ